jgi:CubicO group peptidase (beta-lactamase class C family)
MMRGKPESPQKTYRAARRAFIAACEAAHAETVARLHPAKAPDGRPLFMDCTALGPRHAEKAMLVISYDAPGSEVLVGLLHDVKAPAEARLVLVHALDPAQFAGVAGDVSWSSAVLAAVATEDLSHVKNLSLLSLGRDGETVVPALQSALPEAHITVLPSASAPGQARHAVAAFFGRR